MITVGQAKAHVHTATKNSKISGEFMAYDDKFFEMYSEYLQEPTVRANHNAAFRMFDAFCDFERGHYEPSHTRRNVVDIGCGLGEYARYGKYAKYCGIDKVVRIDPQLLTDKKLLKQHAATCHLLNYGAGPGICDCGYAREFNLQTVEAVAHDYLALGVMHQPSFSSNTFVSLFSIEPIVPEEQRYAFYARLFETCPTLKYGMSAGFYYASLPGHVTVGEAGGIVSHQTIDKFHDHSHPLFTETRIIMETPSKMFGKDVIEVYKMMRRV